MKPYRIIELPNGYIAIWPDHLTVDIIPNGCAVNIKVNAREIIKTLADGKTLKTNEGAAIGVHPDFPDLAVILPKVTSYCAGPVISRNELTKALEEVVPRRKKKSEVTQAVAKR